MIEGASGIYKISFPDLEKFYKESDEFEKTGNLQLYNSFMHVNDPSFRGLSNEQILKSKYSYKEGLEDLKKIETDLNLGGVKKHYKWDELDGDDMDYDRFIDNLNCMKKRVRRIGGRNGRFITIHVGICENCNVSAKEMIIKSYTVIRLIDYLENLNYRVGVVVYGDIRNLGYYKNNSISNLHFEITVKKPEEPLIKPLILTTISPWMFRYHIFKLLAAKFDCFNNMGHSTRVNYESTETDLYIPQGSCLKEDSADSYLEEIAEKFSFDE